MRCNKPQDAALGDSLDRRKSKCGNKGFDRYTYRATRDNRDDGARDLAKKVGSSARAVASSINSIASMLRYRLELGDTFQSCAKAFAASESARFSASALDSETVRARWTIGILYLDGFPGKLAW